jgi:DNA-binding HxlR family transcriptional regulator
LLARGYGQFCPIAKACEVVAERWTPLVLRELLCGSSRFSELHRGLRNMSRTLLAARLRDLETAGVVRSEERPNGHGREYHLTPAGEQLRPIVMLLGEWGQRWAQSQIDTRDLDAELLMIDVHRRLRAEELPQRRVVVRFDFHGAARAQTRPRTWWLVLDREEVDLCHRNPGLSVDLLVNADLRAFAEAWLGRQTFSAAIRARTITLEGPRALVRAFPTWLMLSPVAHATPETATSSA